MVQRIAHHRGAVGGEIVVAITRVLRLGTLGQALGQRTRLCMRQIQPLDAGATARVAVLRQILFQRQRHQVVHHPPAREVADEIRLGRIKETKVVRGGLARHRVCHHQRIVAEALEEDFTRLHRHHADAGRGGSSIGGDGLRGGNAGGQQQQQQCERGQQPPRQPESDQASSWSSGGRMVTWNACTRRASARATRNTKRSSVSSSPFSGRWPMASVTRPPMVS
ncbi:hypothetical protein D3C81_652100 [compost metagenome]